MREIEQNRRQKSLTLGREAIATITAFVNKINNN